MNKHFFVAILCAFSFFGAQAQPYLTAAGIRVFGSNGIGATVLQRLDDGYVLEGQYQGTDDGRWVGTGMFKYHKPIIFGRFWNYYFGVGGHYGSYNKNVDATRTIGQPFYGASGMVGTELTIGRINFALDYKPSVSFTRPVDENQIRHDVGISIRYVLVKPKKEAGFLKKLGEILKDEEGKDKEKKRKSSEL